MNVGWMEESRSEYEAATRRGDREAALACVAGALEHLSGESGPQALVDPWIRALDRELQDGYPKLGAAAESRLLAGGLAVLGRRPAHPVLPLWATRANALLKGRSQIDDAIRAGRFAFEYALRAGDFRQADEVIALVKRRLGKSPVSPAIRVEWFESEALRAWLNVEHDLAYRLVAEGLAMAQGEDDRRGAHRLHEQGASAALSAGDLMRADTHLAAIQSMPAGRPQDVAHGHFLAAARTLLGGDATGAAEDIAACIVIDRDTVPAYFRTVWRLGNAHVHIACGQIRRAERDLAEVLARASGFYWRFLEFSALIHRAWLRLRQGRADAVAVDLERALEQGAIAGYCTCDPWWNPEAMSEIMDLALARGIQTDYVARLVAHRPLR